MSDRIDLSSQRGLAITLVSGSDVADTARVCEVLSGSTAESGCREFDVPDVDEAGLALELASRFADEAARSPAGLRVVALEPAIDVMEVGLVLEHILESSRLVAPVCIQDVVAVSSTAEIVGCLIGAADPVSAVAAEAGDIEVPGRLAARLEFASLIVLKDAGAAPPESRLVRMLLAHLAPAARVLTLAELSELAESSPLRRLHRLPVRGRAHRLGASMGWQLHLAEGAPAAGDLGPIGVHVFRDPRPFHPGRLLAAIENELTRERVGRVARSRGFVRLATRPDTVGSWSTAGDVLDLGPTALRSWDPDSPIGQEIVFFGVELDRDRIDAALTACLLDGSELEAGRDAWARYPDPFPEWAATHHH
ncbi:GTP-binding protein [Herbiconiux liangxiaofengii]|uniref:GTP-binding protein n=1 Tax=Herbiconiux liangxiaofengii TaxID=3342795 RepID=UPI0035B9AE6C